MCTPATVCIEGAEPLDAGENERICREIEKILGGYRPGPALLSRIEGREPRFQYLTLVMARAYDEAKLESELAKGKKPN